MAPFFQYLLTVASPSEIWCWTGFLVISCFWNKPEQKSKLHWYIEVANLVSCAPSITVHSKSLESEWTAIVAWVSDLKNSSDTCCMLLTAYVTLILYLRHLHTHACTSFTGFSMCITLRWHTKIILFLIILFYSHIRITRCSFLIEEFTSFEIF